MLPGEDGAAGEFYGPHPTAALVALSQQTWKRLTPLVGCSGSWELVCNQNSRRDTHPVPTALRARWARGYRLA